MTSDEWVEQMGVTLLDKANLQLAAKEQEVAALKAELTAAYESLGRDDTRARDAESQVADLKRELSGQQRQLARLESFRDLKDGWDNYDGKPINEEAIRTARAILTTAGQTTPMSDGGIQIEWHCGGIDHEIVIQPDGTLEDETIDLNRELAEVNVDARKWQEACSQKNASVKELEQKFKEVAAQAERFRQGMVKEQKLAEGIREAMFWAYQLAGAAGASEEYLDNFSALSEGRPAPHEWQPTTVNHIEQKASLAALISAAERADEFIQDAYSSPGWIAECRTERTDETATLVAAAVKKAKAVT